jgi:hypothetical protein
VRTVQSIVAPGQPASVWSVTFAFDLIDVDPVVLVGAIIPYQSQPARLSRPLFPISPAPLSLSRLRLAWPSHCPRGIHTHSSIHSSAAPFFMRASIIQPISSVNPPPSPIYHSSGLCQQVPQPEPLAVWSGSLTLARSTFPLSARRPTDRPTERPPPFAWAMAGVPRSHGAGWLRPRLQGGEAAGRAMCPRLPTCRGFCCRIPFGGNVRWMRALPLAID